jgi:hypothetical protein
MTTLTHPLETVFNIAPGSTKNLPAEYESQNLAEYTEIPAEVVAQDHKDDAEDIDINDKIETIYEFALTAYENQTAFAEIAEPRYAARNAEVAAQYLNAALSAVALKSRNKSDKRKSKQFIPFNTNISNSNVVVTDRNSIMQMIAEKKKMQEGS